MVEVGFIPHYEPQRFAVLAEGLPMWLFALERSFCSEVVILGYDSARAYRSHLESVVSNPGLVYRAIAHLGLGRVAYSLDVKPPHDALVLVSGSVPFLQDVAAQMPTHPTLLLCTDHWRGRRVPSGPATWMKMRHRSFGGSTHFVALLGFVNLTCVPVETQLRRPLGHIFEYGLRPAFSHGPSLDSVSSALSLEDYLHPHDLTRQVLHPTTYYKTGWGIRCLTPEELGLAFGFPGWLRTGGLSITDFPCVPMQVMDGCLKSLLTVRTGVSPLDTPALRSAVTTPATRTWLPEVQRWLSHSWIPLSLITAKAAKHDEAAVTTSMWDQRILLVFPWAVSILAFLRQRLMCCLRIRLGREFRSFLREVHGSDWSVRLARCRAHSRRGRTRPYRGGVKFIGPLVGHLSGPEEDWSELSRDVIVGTRVLSQLAQADWWNYTEGSTLIFWRWPSGFQRSCARDGMPPWILGPMPRYKQKAKTPKSEDAVLLAPKFVKILIRGYVTIPTEEQAIKSLIDYFYVPKDNDIRPVYNGASCGINLSLWAPNFWLPTGRSALRVLDFDYHMVDIDLGEFFLNFPLPEIISLFSGIDLTPFRALLEQHGFELFVDTDGLCKVRWERCWMGCKPSPFFAVRFFYWGEEFARGNPDDKKNCLRWDRVILNLPGDSRFDPTKPRVMKWDDILMRIAADILSFVDDLRASGFTAEEAWQVARQVASRLQYLGIQDAPRKRRPPSLTPGAWAGGVFSTKDKKVTKSVTQEKWDKGKRLIHELISESNLNPLHDFSYKRLEQVRGFLCHLSMTYETLTPFLKGFHLTLSSYLPHRDANGWKLSDKQWEKQLLMKVERGEVGASEAQEIIEDERLSKSAESEWAAYLREEVET
jgi:hypothetical protein